MFHLKPRIHLDEIELAILIQELERSGTVVAKFGRRLAGDLADGGAFCCGQAGGGGFFQHFLVAALQRAVAFAQVYTVAVLIGQNLDFDMAGGRKVFFQIHFGVAKAGLCLGLGQVIGLEQLVIRPGHFHALATTAASGLDQHRIAYCPRNRPRLFHRGKTTF